MPELPEVEITKLKLAPTVGKTIVNFWTDLSSKLVTNLSIRQLQKDIQHYSIVKLTRTGKVLFIHLERNKKIPKLLAFHQRMSGRFKITEQVEQPTKHTRVIITFSDHSQLHFLDPRKFGVVWYGEEKEIMKHSYLQKLGPDALNISFEIFLQRLSKFKGTIKPILLRQDTVAGIGNIVVDETLWASFIHPETKLPTLSRDQLKQIHTSLQQVLKKSIEAKGSTLRDWKHPDGQPGTFVEHMNIYGKGGQKCTRCQTIILRKVVGGRGTWICTTCQQLM